jgi:hypothetical protein
MKKSDLKTGMIVVTSDDEVWVVFKDFVQTKIVDYDDKEGYFVGKLAWNPICVYDNELIGKWDSITRVYKPRCPGNIHNIFTDKLELDNEDSFELIWDRFAKDQEKEELKQIVSDLRKNLNDAENRLKALENQ